jgi:hypothetical protein
MRLILEARGIIWVVGQEGLAEGLLDTIGRYGGRYGGYYWKVLNEYGIHASDLYLKGREPWALPCCCHCTKAW